MNTWQIKNGDIALDLRGRINVIGGSSKVVQDLKNWLINEVGYNRFHPQMGTDLDNFVGQNINPTVLNDVRNMVRQALEDYMSNQMEDLRKRIEERGDPYVAISLAEPSSLVKTWTNLNVTQSPGAINIFVAFRTFTDDVEEVELVLTSGTFNQDLR